MNYKKPVTPFPTSGYYGPEYFCNRKDETQTLLNNLKGGQSTVLTAIRKIGKTALVKHVQGLIPKGWLPVYIDILYTENEAHLLNALYTGIANSLPENTLVGKKIWDFIKSMRPLINFDSLTGTPQVSFNVSSTRPELHVSAIMEFLSRQKQKIIIAIDEFQQITNYPEKNTDAWLRGIIQNLQNVFFIFSGSHQHIMGDLFSNPSKPFFRSAQLMNIGKIPTQEYISFISKKFKEHGKLISDDVIQEMLTWTHCHTFYVQLLCNQVFLNPVKNINTSVWQDEALKLLKEQEAFFFQFRDMLTNAQWQLLKSVAREGMVYSPTSKEFIAKYTLGSPATVLRSLETLIKKELVYKIHDSKGVTYYSVYDVLFQRWIENR